MIFYHENIKKASKTFIPAFICWHFQMIQKIVQRRKETIDTRKEFFVKKTLENKDSCKKNQQSG